MALNAVCLTAEKDSSRQEINKTLTNASVSVLIMENLKFEKRGLFKFIKQILLLPSDCD